MPWLVAAIDAHTGRVPGFAAALVVRRAASARDDGFRSWAAAPASRDLLRTSRAPRIPDDSVLPARGIGAHRI